MQALNQPLERLCVNDKQLTTILFDIVLWTQGGPGGVVVMGGSRFSPFIVHAWPRRRGFQTPIYAMHHRARTIPTPCVPRGMLNLKSPYDVEISGSIKYGMAWGRSLFKPYRTPLPRKLTHFHKFHSQLERYASLQITYRGRTCRSSSSQKLFFLPPISFSYPEHHHYRHHSS